jgi:outer membrane lipoprotein-sorting protein
MKMKKIIVLAITLVLLLTLAGCGTQASRASYNLSKQADNFNVVRQVTIINCIEGDVLFQMTGKLSIEADEVEDQLEIIVEDNGTYVKHFIGLSDNVTYVIEDLNMGANDVSNYRYTINFNPKMWLPVNVETVD